MISILLNWWLDIIRRYDLENSIGFVLYRTAMAFRKALDLELRRKTGVTFGQWKILAMLSREDGLTQKEIADRCEVEGPTLIPIIDKMEKEGLVTRKVDREDRRINRIFLTTKADATWNSLLDCSMQVRKSSIRDIPEEQVKIMRDVLEKISQNLMIDFGVDHYCKPNSVTSTGNTNITIASTNQQRKKAKL
jgi:MarR family transcriptional regulator for hemolysin